MSRKSKILIGVSIVMLLVVITTLVLTNKKNKTQTEPLPSKVVIPTREPEPTWFSETGAVYISPTDQEYTVQGLLADLRNKCPMENDIFLVSYNYSSDKFQFVLKDKKNGEKKLIDWMSATGYSQIPAEFIEVK